MKLISEDSFGDSGEKCDESVRCVLGLGSTDTMVVGFKEIEKVYNLATHDFKMQVNRTSCSLADKLG
jgi:hypothetical protein